MAAHGLDVALTLGIEPWTCRPALNVTRPVLVSLLGAEPPARLAWDDRTLPAAGTGRWPLTHHERTVLGSLQHRFPFCPRHRTAQEIQGCRSPTRLSRHGRIPPALRQSREVARSAAESRVLGPGPHQAGSNKPGDRPRRCVIMIHRGAATLDPAADLLGRNRVINRHHLSRGPALLTRMGVVLSVLQDLSCLCDVS